MATATFLFHEELNDFLPPDRRRRTFPAPFTLAATTKHMIEALGVPHTEVAAILVNGAAVDFEHRLQDGDCVSVYPRLESPGHTPLRAPLSIIRFIADAHLGGLARLLRMAGFDTLYRNDYRDAEIAQIAGREARIVLSRDRDLLKHRAISHGCYLHAIEPAQQFRELVRRLDLTPRMRPFTLCLSCNEPLHAIDRDAVLERLPPAIRTKHTRFTTCGICHRVFWKGSHWLRMRDAIDVVGQPGCTPDGPPEPAA